MLTQELLEQIIDFLHDRESDLKACSLVSRAHRLDIRLRQISCSVETYAAICNFPFTHLKAVYTTLTLFSASAIALQQLLVLPTLRSAQIGCASYDPATFMRIWDRCSPTIRHLGIHLRDLSIEEVPPTLPLRFAPIRLESLSSNPRSLA
ncbi:hypothetical protein DFH09DRAFT_1318759 [Mycena vulgaris]|nr:hypothetical protein DFH09DRAFT_1318759 [Mycena vulgaris]